MKVAIYCRLSEEDRNKQFEQDDSESIQNQKSLLIQHAMNNSWDIYNIYSDDDYTGSDRNRPAFNQLIRDAEQHRFDIVLCKTQSRFTRELELVEKYIHGLFPIWNIRFISIVDNADTDNKGNKKSRQINGLINEWYLEDMSENIKSVLTNKRQNGQHIGAFALYGYMKDPEQKGHLIIDEKAAEIVRDVFTLFSLGTGKTAIARMLNDRGIPNPTEYKRLNGLRYSQPKGTSGTLWKYSAISSMLNNEIYIGNMVQGKYGSVSYKTKKNQPRPKSEWYIVEGTHEPIIPIDLWNKVQTLIKSKVKPFKTGNIGIFSKKVKCISCGYYMRTHKNHNRYYLQCSTRYVSKNSCIGAFVPVKELEQAILSELNVLKCEYFDNNKIETEIVSSSGEVTVKKSQRIKDDIRNHQIKALEYSDYIRSLYIDKVKGIITDEQFTDFLNDFSQKRVTHEKVIEELTNELKNLNTLLKEQTNRKEIIQRYANTEVLDREMIEKLIDCIYVGKRDPETKALAIEIHWNF